MRKIRSVSGALLCATLLASGAAKAQTAPLKPGPAMAVVPLLELQVLSASVPLREAPDGGAAVLAQAERGQLLSVLEQRGEWYRVGLSARQSGWVLRAPGEYGDMTVALFPAKGSTLYAADAAADAAILQARPGTRARTLLTLPPIDPQQVAPPQANLPRESIAVPDRWRLMQTLGFKFPLYDPYNQNPLKGDLPVLKNLGEELFFNLGVISDSLLESRRLPTPVSGQTGIAPGANDIFGGGRQNVLAHNLIVSLGLIKGDTTFRPPDYELRFVPVFNFNRAHVQEAGALNINPSTGTRRVDNFVGVQELFADVHLRNVSERYDFDSLRVGVQPFTNDFRGFLFQDSPFGVRLFGNRGNNQFQYNLAWFRRFEKDSNSGLNDIAKGLRKDDLFLANLFRQDFPVLGFTSQLSFVHNRNNEKQRAYDSNGFLVRPAFVGDVRPHSYRVNYLGYSGDGHFGVWNLSTSAYAAIGSDEHNPIAQKPQRIRAGFFAGELSRDYSWLRLRGNVMLASGDKDPFDDVAGGYDAIFENPQFAGSDTSFYIRQAMPLIGGGGVALAGRNSLLPSLRSSKDEGQSNFVNPGLSLLGVGADADLSPQLRLFGNVSSLRFMETSSLALLRNQAPPSRAIGTDYSVGFHWRPFFTQNMIVNGSAAALKPGAGLKALYGAKQGTFYSLAFNAVLTF
ncbi:hypothetical protein ACFDR9_000614 [Janthinobacterium sp. CG_23.3]|uniref:SH3 domain-containing protein n=1 Tax=Janthinobacterium sp. CG_23.3 TaxID=3349634 RepID=UPI0038D36B11